MAGGREIEDGQAAVAEHAAAVRTLVEPRVVRTAVGQRVSAAGDGLWQPSGRLTVELEVSRDATHQRISALVGPLAAATQFI
jgi:hypothetical protein